MYLLIPGRHHILTRFQAQYLFRLVHSELKHDTDIHGIPLRSEPIEGIIFAVTSANHQKTRRNPFSYTHRALAIHSLNRELSVPVYCFPINDTGFRGDFAAHIIKTVAHASDGTLLVTPINTIVICATPVFRLYEKLGFTIFGAESPDGKPDKTVTPLPWNIVEKIAASPDWQCDPFVLTYIYPGSLEILIQYNLANTIKFVFNDPIIGDDGDLTETRDYTSYVRQMDEIADIKWNDVKKYVLPGLIGDIGCSAGSWLKLATLEAGFTDSDFYGIEIARKLFQICEQRKNNGEFSTPNIWFSQKNAVTGLVFQPESMNTIHSSSLTHEIESYGNRKELLAFISNRYKELQPGGVWINRDVIGPENKDELCLLRLNETDGNNSEWDTTHVDSISGLSTLAKFYRFAKDFRATEGYTMSYREIRKNTLLYIELRMEDAVEFLLTKDYTDNWESEMHERFCFWSLTDWKNALIAAGFEIHPDTHAFTNPWIVEKRFKDTAELFSLEGEKLDYPCTNAILIGRKLLL